MIYLFSFLFVSAPLYIWRFSIFGLPTNFLMLLSGIVIVIGFVEIIKSGKTTQFYKLIRQLPRFILWSTGLFIASSLLALFVNGLDVAKLGQWTVLVVEPILVASLIYYYVVQFGHRDKLLWAMYVFVGVSGGLAVLQYFFLITLPPDWLGNPDEPKRAISFFVHPNNYALFVTPLLAYLIPGLSNLAGKIRHQLWSSELIKLSLWKLGAIGLLLSLSRGGWIALLAAAGVFVLIKANKKLLISFASFLVLISIVVAVVPNLRYRVILPFYGEKSSVARFSLWETGQKMVLDSPILGQGLNGFNYRWDTFNTDPGLDHYNFPHNIVLNFWVDFGLLGLISFLLILIWGIYFGFRNRGSPYGLGLLLAMIAVLVHGMIDIPYLRNDLALVFWIIIALSLSVNKNIERKP